MGLFKKQEGKEQMGARLGKAIIKMQTAFAERMNTAASKLSARKLKMNLALFCLAGGGISIYLAMNGIVGGGKESAIKIEQASVPKHFDRAGDEIKDVQNMIDDDLYQQVKLFRAYMDSLQLNDKTAFDSILLSRPGLLDSIQTIEAIYLSQQIK